MPNAYAKGLGVKPKVDKRLYDLIWGEASGGSPQEVAAVASVFINRMNKEGYEKALKGSSAYARRSPQYLKAASGDMNVTERTLYNRNKEIVDRLINEPELVAPFTHFENIREFGEPSWAKDMIGVDIGRQRFYRGK